MAWRASSRSDAIVTICITPASVAAATAAATVPSKRASVRWQCESKKRRPPCPVRPPATRVTGALSDAGARTGRRRRTLTLRRSLRPALVDLVEDRRGHEDRGERTQRDAYDHDLGKLAQDLA